MSMIFDNHPATVVGRLFEDTVTGAWNMIHRIRRRAVEKHNQRTLHALPDHILRDIGISRGDINYLTRGEGHRNDTRQRALDSLKGGWVRRDSL